MKIKLLTIIVLIGFSSLIQALPASLEQQINAHISTFQADESVAQKDIAKSLEWAGISDPRLFNLIEAKLLDSYLTAKNKQNVEYLSWMAKALSFSGQQQYRTTLEKVASDSAHAKLRKHAQKAINILPNYTYWNSLIIDEKHWDNTQSLDTNRFLAMINSDVLELKRLAAKRIYYTHLYQDILLDTLEKQLLDNYQVDRRGKLFSDSWAWICKALASSRKKQYQDTIKKVAISAENSKLKRYANKYLHHFDSQ